MATVLKLEHLHGLGFVVDPKAICAAIESGRTLCGLLRLFVKSGNKINNRKLRDSPLLCHR